VFDPTFLRSVLAARAALACAARRTDISALLRGVSLLLHAHSDLTWFLDQQ
jgi:hypothetical protein